MYSPEQLGGGVPPDDFSKIVSELVIGVLTVEELSRGDHDSDTEQLLMTKVIREINERAFANPYNQPDRVIDRVTSRFQSTSRSTKSLDTLDQLLSRYKLTLKRIRQADLEPYDEIALLKAAAIAGFSRETDQGLNLATRAMRILHHEATNYMNATGSNERSLLLARSIYAIRAVDDIFDADDAGAQPIKSADEVLQSWGNFEPAQTDEPEIPRSETVLPSLEVRTDDGRRVGFRRLLHAEAKARLDGLHIIGDSLQDSLGLGARVRYFEPIVFNDREDIPTPDEDDALAREPGTETRSTEDSTYLTGDYVIAEATHESDVYVIAESPNYGNACYVMRGDVLSMVASTLGVELDWRQVLGYPKVTARQLGARDFRHGGRNNVPERVLDYLNGGLEQSLQTIASRWFVDEKAIYDEHDSLTRFNRLPITLTQTIANRIPDIRVHMMPWLGQHPERRVAVRQSAGRTALREDEGEAPTTPEVTQSSDPVVEALQQRIEEQAVELERMRLENIRLRARLQLARLALDES